MKTLISSAQVNALAFRGALREELISQSAIIAAEQRYIFALFGGCYEQLLAGEEPYAELFTDYIQPALAEYVKLDLLPALAAQVGSDSIVQYGGTGVGAPNTRGASDVSLARLTKAVSRDARTLLQRAVKRAVELKIITAPRKRVLGGMIF